MSDVYIRRLRAIQDDLDIAVEVFTFVCANWHRQEIVTYFHRRTFARVVRAGANLDITYFVRLTAEFEGILKDHLRTNHSAIHVPANARIDWLLARVIQRENITLDPGLRQRLNEVRDYRNALAHGNIAPLVVTFVQALARYNTFLSYIPDPHNP